MCNCNQKGQALDAACDCEALRARIAELENQVNSQAQQVSSQVEIEVEARTRDLQAVNQLLKLQSKTMTQHFACMYVPLCCVVGIVVLWNGDGSLYHCGKGSSSVL